MWVSEASCAFPWLGLAEALVLRLGTSPPAEQKLPATWAQELRLPGFSAEPVPRPCPGLCDPWSVAHQAPLSTGPSRQEYRVGSLARLQGVFLTQLSRTAGGFFPVWVTREAPGLTVMQGLTFRHLKSSRVKVQACVSCLGGQLLTTDLPGKPSRPVWNQHRGWCVLVSVYFIFQLLSSENFIPQWLNCLRICVEDAPRCLLCRAGLDTQINQGAHHTVSGTETTVLYLAQWFHGRVFFLLWFFNISFD